MHFLAKHHCVVHAGERFTSRCQAGLSGSSLFGNAHGSLQRIVLDGQNVPVSVYQAPYEGCNQPKRLDLGLRIDVSAERPL